MVRRCLIAATLALSLAACAEPLGTEVGNPTLGTTWLIYAFDAPEDAAFRDDALERLRLAEPQVDRVLVETAFDGRLRRLELRDHEWVELADRDGHALADPAELADFIASAELEEYALNMLIVRGRGFGVSGIGGDAGPGGGRLSYPELRRGIADGVARAGLDRLRGVMLDAAFSATIEVALELQPVAQYLYAHEGYRPLRGLDLGIVGGGDFPFNVEADLAAHGALEDVLLAEIDLFALEGFAEALVAACDDLRASPAPSAAALLRAAGHLTRRLGDGIDPAASPGLVDLPMLIFFARSETAGLPDPLDALADRLALVRPLVQDSSGLIQQATGLAVHLPRGPEELAEGYEEFEAMAPWAEALRAIWAAADDSRHVAFATGEVRLEPDGGVQYLEARIVPEDYEHVASAGVRAGTLEPDGTFRVLVDHAGQCAREPAALEAALPIDAFALRLGDRVAFGHVTTRDNLRRDPLFLHAEYVREGQAPETVAVRFAPFRVRPEEPRLRYLRGATQGYAEFEPEPGSRLRPLVLVRGPEGTEELVAGDLEFDPLDPSLQVTMEPLPPGTPLHVEASVGNLAGAGTTVTIEAPR